MPFNMKNYDKVLITFDNFGLLFNMMTTQLVGPSFCALRLVFFKWNFFSELILCCICSVVNAFPDLKFIDLQVSTWQWKTQLYVGGALTGQCFNMSLFLNKFAQHESWSHYSFQVSCMSPVPFLSKPITQCGFAAEAWGLLTSEPQDIIWFHFHSNRFPLWDLILVSQYELWPWISTGLQLVFNVHQSSMWESSPHSGVLLTQPSPSRPTLGPSGPSQVPNHTSVSTVAKLFQSDWHPSVREHS